MTTVAPEQTEQQQETWSGQSVPRKEDRRLVQGQGVFVDDVKRHGMGFLHFVRSPYAHAHITSIDVSAAEQHPGVYGTLTGEEVAALTDPFFQIASVPGANVKDYALAVGKVRYVGEPIVAVVAETREAARDASELVEVEFEPLDAITDARQAQADGVPTIHEDAGGNLMWHGVYEWGDLDAAFAEADKVVKIDELHFHRFNSTPLECDGALVEYNRGMGQWTITTNNQFPGFAIIMMGPAMKVGLDKLRFVTQDIGGGFGNKITSHPQLVACCLLARKLNRPVQWTEWRTDFHLSMSHGNERWFHETEVAVKNDGTLLGFRTKALDDAGAYLRYEPLGGVIWAQVTPGMYKWKNIRVDFTQVATNKAPVSPNRGYSRMQHLWFTERIIDIVAHELDLDPVEIRKRNYVRAEDMPYTTPNGCVYDSGDYARMLDIALDLVDYPSLDAKRADAKARGKLLGLGIGSTLDSGTNNFGQSRMINPELQFSGNNEVATVKLDIFGEIVVTLGTTPQGQGHETTAAQVVADILKELARRLLRHVCVAVRGHRAERGERRNGDAARRDLQARRRGLRRCAGGGARTGRRRHPHQGEPGGVPAVHGLRGDHQREQRRPPGGPGRDAELPLRLPAAVRGAGRREEVREPDAHVCDADPRRGDRDRPRDGLLRHRRLRRRRRLRQADQPTDRRGPGDGCDGAGARGCDTRAVRLRRGRQPADPQLLRLPRAARARHAAAPDRQPREPVAVHAARHEGHG
jgi:CO/xanthine dehydrogenase Mo-binding subunit